MNKIIKLLAISIAVNLGLFASLEVQKQNYESAIEIYQYQVSELTLTNKTNEEKINELDSVLSSVTRSYPVYFTNYYEGDGSSSSKTGSGLTVDDFQINDKGWYTYQDKVVVAAATWEGIQSDYGVLAEINDLPTGYHIYHYYDEITFQIEGAEYDGIILDTCGASMMDMDEEYQRMDIFISNKEYSIGKKVGSVYE